MTFDRQLTVAQLVLDHPETAQVFKEHKIDFCCRGKVTVEAAARELGIEPALVVSELDLAIGARSSPRDDPSPASLETRALIELIVARHHVYLRKTLPFLGGLSAKVLRVHGDKNARLAAIDATLRELDRSLIAHLDDEEGALFPLLASDAPDRSRARAELEAMHAEHLAVGELLQSIRREADEFVPPSWACTSYRTLMTELEAMESDIFRHIHLETHVLMPRFAPEAS